MASRRPVRRAQLISPFGVGSMVDFPHDESLMTAGLDVWPGAHDKPPGDWLIHEERLQKRLNVSHFRLPPDFRTGDTDPRYQQKTVPFIRFPRWHYCPDPGCGRLVKRSLFDTGVSRCRDSKHQSMPPSKIPKVVPVRFVAICEKGHIEDFPFMEWVHDGQSMPDEGHVLYYRAGKSAALPGITIECSCGKRRNLGGVFGFNSESGSPLSAIGYQCKGLQPWLGISSNEVPCGEHLRVVQKGGSNVYFPATHSSIYLPLWAEGNKSAVIKVLEDPTVWQVLTSGLDDGKHIQRAKCEAVAAMRGGIDVDELLEAAQKKLDGAEEMAVDSEEQFRFSEYEAFKNERGTEESDLLVRKIDIERYQQEISQYFESICLLPKLKETRVLSGFTRLLPPDNDDSTVQSLHRGRTFDWLPAMEVRGEGIFFEFNKEKVDQWAEESTVKSQVREDRVLLWRH